MDNLLVVSENDENSGDESIDIKMGKSKSKLLKPMLAPSEKTQELINQKGKMILNKLE